MAVVRQQIGSAGEVEKRKTLCSRDANWNSHYGDSMEVPKKLQTELSFPAVPHLSIYLDKTYNSKRHIHLCVPSSAVYSSYEMAVSYACITR